MASLYDDPGTLYDVALYDDTSVTPPGGGGGGGGTGIGSASSWPRVPLPVGVEIHDGTQWIDITSDVSADDGIIIRRGRPDRASTCDPASLDLELANPTGRYSPRNPASDLYGRIGRNTPIRVWAALGAPRLVQPTGEAATATGTGLQVTGDLDIRVDVSLATWRPAGSSWAGVLRDGAYGLWVDPAGYLLWWWVDGGGTARSIASTQPLPGGTTGRKVLRATLDVDNGAGGHTARFYVASATDPSVDSGTWVEVGSAVTGAGVTSVAAAAGQALTTATTAAASVYAVQVRSGITGAVVADADFAAATVGDAYTDAAGLVWTTGPLTSKRWRFHGEVAEWPLEWGPKGAVQARAPIECAGLTRRYGTGASPVASPMRRGCQSLPSLVAYWPLEDGTLARELTAVLGVPVQLTGAVRPGTVDPVDAASASLVEVGSGRISLQCPPSTPTGSVQVRMVLIVPDGGIPDGAVIARVHTGGTLQQVDVLWSAAGAGVYAVAHSGTGAVLATTASVPLGAASAQRISLELSTSGASSVVKIVQVEAASPLGYVSTVTAPGVTPGAPTTITLNPTRAALAGLGVGHVTVESSITSVFDLQSPLSGHIGERADTRVGRLCGEHGIPVLLPGAGGGATRMGAQRTAELMDLLRAAADADGGILTEARDAPAIAYRSGDSLLAQDPAVTIAYVDNLLRPLAPVDDDAHTLNVSTVTRDGGASATVWITGGPLGSATIGVYDADTTLNLATDAAAVHEAAWRAHLGTLDEARWPRVGIHLQDPPWLADPAATRDVLELDLGDRVDITDLPPWVPPYPISGIVEGYEETLTPFGWDLELNLSPARGHQVGAWSSTSRWDTSGSVLAGPVDADDTVLPVVAEAGPAWTTDPADLPLDLLVDGEQVRVTWVTGPGPQQWLTVARGRGATVAVAHAAGTPVRLAEPAVWGHRPDGGQLWTPAVVGPDSVAVAPGSSGGSVGDPSTTPPPT